MLDAESESLMLKAKVSWFLAGIELLIWANLQNEATSAVSQNFVPYKICLHSFHKAERYSSSVQRILSCFNSCAKASLKNYLYFHYFVILPNMVTRTRKIRHGIALKNRAKKMEQQNGRTERSESFFLAWTLKKPIFLRVRQIFSLVTINPFTQEWLASNFSS